MPVRDLRVLAHLRPARRALARVLAASLVEGLLTVAQAVAVGTLVVAVVTDPANGELGRLTAWVVAVVALRALASYVVNASASTAAGQVSTAMRHRLLEAMSRLDPARFARHPTGELALTATRGTAAVEPYLTRYLPSLVLACVLPVATVAAIFWFDWMSGLIVLCTLPLMPVFAALIGVSARARAARQWRQLSALSGHFLDVVRGLPTLVAYRRADAQAATIRAVTDRYRRATVETLRLGFASAVVLELVATLSVALVAVCVGLRLAAGSMDFRVAMIVLLLAPEAYWPLRRVGAEFHAAAEGTASFDAADRFLTGEPEPRSGLRTDLAGPIQLDALTMGYGDRSVLDHVSARFDHGMTAIVGPSGCGKSTLLACVAGEASPTSGSVRVGDVDLCQADPEAWRSRLAWAPQRPWLSHGTLAENLRVGRPGASDEELWRALERVDLGHTVAALPLGLETILGQDGAGLSAGERARVALARVVLAGRPYVLLDEPTAHLDAETEEVLLDTMRWLAKRSTVVVVAHRPAVARAADRVLSLPASAHLGSAARGPVTPATDHGSAAASERHRAEPISPPPPADPEASGIRGTTAGVALGTLSVASGVALTATAAWLITRASEQPPFLYLMAAIVGVRAFGLARPVFRYLERLVSHDAALCMLAEHRAQVYDALVPLVPGRLGPRRGDVLASVVDDVDALVDHQLRVRQPLWTAGLVGAGATVFAALVTPAAGLVVAGTLSFAAVAALIARWHAEREPVFVQARAELSTRVEDMVAGMRQLVAWQAVPDALAGVDGAGLWMGSASRRSARDLGACRALVGLGCGLGVVAMASVVPEDSTSAAMLALLLLLPLALADAVLPVVDAATIAVRTRSAARRLAALTGASPVVTDSEVPTALPSGRPTLEVRDVTAGWGEEDVVRDLSATLSHGLRLGLVGPSGSGKSTVAALLIRFLDPRRGALLLSGVDLRALALDDVRRDVGLVDDDPYVFASTLAANVRLARPAAEDAEVAAALSAAHLGPWLDGLPDGLLTLVGEGHHQVSGGERARLGIARAILADQPILVLDEPTAHLDTSTAQAVADDLLTASSGRSVLWITHGTVGLEAMDQVIRLIREPDEERVSPVP
jgi:ATP-binding cassette, subfamily C, bacterial CydCD